MRIMLTLTSKSLRITMLLIVLALAMMVGYTQQLNPCFFMYPNSYGDNLSDTDIRAIDMDISGYVVTGGISYSSNLKSATQTTVAVFAYYENIYGTLLWVNKLSILNCRIRTLHMQDSTGRAQKALSLIYDYADSKLIFLVIDLINSGNILSIFKDTTATFTLNFSFYQSSVFYDSAGFIFLSLSQISPVKLIFAKINPQPTSVSTFAPTWSLVDNSGSSSSIGLAVAKGTQTNEMYFTTRIQVPSLFNQQQYIHRFNVATPSLVASYKYTTVKASAILIADFSSLDVVQVTPGVQTIIGCGYYQYQSTDYIMQLLKLEFDLTTGNINSQFVIEIPKMIGQYDFLLVKTFNILATTASVLYQKMKVQNAYWIYWGNILPTYEALYSGSYFNLTISSSNEQAFYQISDLSKSCSNYEYTPVNTTLTNKAFSSILFVKETTNIFTTVSMSFASQTTVTQTSVAVSFMKTTMTADNIQGCSDKQTYTPVTISGTNTYTLPTQHLKQNGDFQFDMDTLFTGDSLCSDKIRIYTISAVVGNTNTYTISSTKYLFAAQASLSASTDQILVTALFVDGQTSSVTVTITILDCYASSQITLPTALSSVTYNINGTAQTKNLNSYTKVKSYCSNPSISFSISPSITPSTAVQLDGTTKILTISSNNLLSSGTYTVSVIYTNPINTSDKYTFTFSLNILCLASISVLSSGFSNIFQYNLRNGTKSFDLRAQSQESTLVDLSQNHYDPKFQYTLPTISIQCGTKREYQLPKVIDQDNHAVSVSFTLNYGRLPKNYSMDEIDKQFLDIVMDEEYFKEQPKVVQQEFLDFNATIIQISVTGDVDLKVNQDLTFNESYSKFEDLEIRITFQSNYADQAYLRQWRIVSYKDRVVRLKLQFTHSEKISLYESKYLNDKAQLKEKLICGRVFKSQEYCAIKILYPELSQLRKKYNYMIWNMLCMLQLIIHLPLFDSNFPAVSLYFVKNIISPINLDLATEIFKFFNYIPLLGKYFNQESINYFDRDYNTEPIQKYKTIGYESINAFKFNYNSRLILNISVAIFILMFVSIFAFQLIYMLKTYKQKYSVQEYRQKFGSLYDDIDTECKYYEYYILLFYLRRIVYGLFLPSYPIFFQIFFQLIFSSIAILYIIRFKPMKNHYQNYQCLFNEVTLVICLYITLMLSDVQSTRKAQYKIGWFYNSIVVICIIANMAAIFGLLISNIFKKKNNKTDIDDEMMFNQTQVRLFETTGKQIIETDQQNEESLNAYSFEKDYQKPLARQYKKAVETSDIDLKPTSGSDNIHSTYCNTSRPIRQFLTNKTINNMKESLQSLKKRQNATDRRIQHENKLKKQYLSENEFAMKNIRKNDNIKIEPKIEDY
eukprot:403350588